MPKEERPRERLCEDGVESLSNEELLAILLRTGSKDESVIDLSKRVLYHLDHLEDLKKMSVHELLTIKGIKLAKAATVIAAIELGRRLAKQGQPKRVKITASADIYHALSAEIGHLEQEHFYALYLNVKGEVIQKVMVFKGTVNQTLIHPREIFKQAIRLASTAVIFCHNHPTGDSSPSKADLVATEKLIDAAQILGIDVVDHVIIGHHEYFSIQAMKKTKLPLCML